MLGGRSNFSTLAFFLVLSLLLLLLQVPSSSGSSQEFCDAKENDRACRDDNLKKGGAVIQDDLEVDFEDEDETVPEEHDRVEDGEPTEIFDKKGDSCVHFNLAQFTAESPSIMLIEAKGRLGNHMIAFTLVQALSKVLKVKGFTVLETKTYLSQYFHYDESVPNLEETFCNFQDIPFQRFDGTIQELVENKKYHKGRILDLWATGYQTESKKCCPAQDLQTFVQKNSASQARESLKFREKFSAYADSKRNRAAELRGVPVQDITFVGIHNRRTDYIPYMAEKFGAPNPYKKRYFYDAMDYFREDNDGDTVFFYVSDDMEWGRKNLRDKHRDLYFVGTGSSDDPDSIGYDLALLASCNHSIMTWGSFSMWGTFLAGGKYYSEYGVIIPEHLQEPEKKKKGKKN